MADLISAESKSAGKVFSKGRTRRYRVPHFQRSFSWTSENVNDLWEDLRDAIEGQKYHFLGSLVLQSDSRSRGDKYFIYDGQQRLMVVTALVGLIRHSCKNIQEKGIVDQDLITDCERLITQAERFLFDPDKNQLILQLSEYDKRYFRACITNAKYFRPSTRDTRSDDVRHKSNDFLKKHVFQNLQAKVDKELASCDLLGGKLGYLRELLDAIRNKLYFVEIRVDKRFSDVTLFETLNFRGTPLKVHDLFKSFLFAKAEKQKTLSDVKDEWDQIIRSVERNKISLPKFLKVFWIASHGKTVEGSLYKLFKKDLEDDPEPLLSGDNRSATPASRYATKIFKTLKVYERVVNPPKNAWKADPEVGHAVEGINLSGEEASHPFLVALLSLRDGRSDVGASDFRRTRSQLLRAIEAFSVRNRFCKQWRHEDMLLLYAKHVRTLETNPLESMKGLIAELKRRLPDKSSFESKFSEDASTNKKFAMYLLHKIERHLSPRKEPPSREPSDVTLEHIMPRQIGRGWPHVGGYHREYLNRLGNLTLLSHKLNVTNKGFKAKKSYYSESNVAMTRRLGKCNTWGKRAIQERQRQLAAIASQVWRI